MNLNRNAIKMESKPDPTLLGTSFQYSKIKKGYLNLGEPIPLMGRSKDQVRQHF
jgi:hypothetical protein